MTDYERLAADLTAAGLHANTATAYRLATRAFHGEGMTDRERQVVAAWEARTTAQPWHPDTTRQKGSGVL